ncbi:hypothetical protein JTE90_027332 [Oedothorax gibbosus]|uniref:Reverse transcriptase domain-containing protein n=1 Tax=Oedothorax gibbosus TaxID=931172 RepID=A0AAV6VXW4_9ARAC|nr:hypothetical protein JTE90_027332 [Oedothorax gibbosus]
MISMGVIKRFSDPTLATSLMFVVRQKGKIRVCMDPSGINKNLRGRHYPLRTLEEIASCIRGFSWVTLLNCKKGFWQIPVTERSSSVLTMGTLCGRYTYLRMLMGLASAPEVFQHVPAMKKGFWQIPVTERSSSVLTMGTLCGRYTYLIRPMGLASAPEVFQQVMEQLIGEIKNVEFAMDDILIHGSSKSEAEATTKKVLRIFNDAGLSLNTDKCIYAKNELKFLGHIVTKDGLKADPDKVKAICALKEPIDVVTLQIFLGMVTYLAKFLPNLSEITAEMRELCKKDVPFNWTAAHQSAFEHLKNLLKELPVLKIFNVNLTIVLSVVL